MSKEIVQKSGESIERDLKDSNHSSVGEAPDIPQEEQTQETSAEKTETIVIDGISIKLNYSDKKNDHVLDNIKKTLVYSWKPSKETS